MALRQREIDSGTARARLMASPEPRAIPRTFLRAFVCTRSTQAADDNPSSRG
jgi:hypothetical protein